MFISRHLCEAVEYNPQFRDKELKDCPRSHKKSVAELRGQKCPILAYCVKHSTVASFWFQLEIDYLMLALN